MPRPNAKDPHGFLEPSNTRQPVQQCARRYLPAATDLLPERSDNVLHSSMKAFVPGEYNCGGAVQSYKGTEGTAAFLLQTC